MPGDPRVAAHAVAAVVFDWAGTVVDFGSRAPADAFVELFARRGIELSVAEARAPMGLPKWDHIHALALQPRVAKAWRSGHGGQAMTTADIDALYAEYLPINREAVLRHGELVPGTSSMVAALRERGIRIGSTTGYTRTIIAPLLPVARSQGFAPDCVVCADDVPASRPTPLAMYRCFLDLEVWPARRVVKIDDTLPGLLEGRHAGCWTVAVTASGNEVGLALDEWQALAEDERERVSAAAAERLAAARPNYTVRTVADLAPVIASINQRLAAGERPPA
jgi:phosphonoacetaldehyde hydrolase